jgi:hypothetical protein
MFGMDHWIYDSIHEAHDGLLDVYFAPGTSESSRRVAAVLFTPGADGFPSDMPKLLGLTRKELTDQFGEPLRQGTLGAQGDYLEFRNGVVTLMWEDKAREYGVYALP